MSLSRGHPIFYFILQISGLWHMLMQSMYYHSRITIVTGFENHG